VTRSPNLGVGGRFSFQAVFGVDRGLSSVHLDTGLSIQVLFGGGGGFVLLSANGNAQGALLLSLEGGKDFYFILFFILPCFPLRSHAVPSKFLLGSQYVLQVHNVFPNMFSIYARLYRWKENNICQNIWGGPMYIKTEPSILRSLHSFIFLGAMGQSNWLVAHPPKY